MSERGLGLARAKMRSAGIDGTAIDVFSHYYRQLESGAKIGRASCRERV